MKQVLMRLSIPKSIVVVALFLPSLVACQTTADYLGGPGLSAAVQEGGDVLDLRDVKNLDGILDELAGSRVIYVGEAHDEYAHHLKQLEIIRKLHARYPDIAIGMEQFQTPFQTVLDNYIAGRSNEKEMLRDSEWYRRWRFDYRLYRPILTYAREQGIPVVALNVPREITDTVAKQGMEGLTPEERAALPEEIDRSDEAYKSHLLRIFREHPHADKQDFERFYQVQLLWDEGMAQRAVDYLREHPGRKMVLLAGGGHLSYGYGIPKRVARRLPEPYSIVLPAGTTQVQPGIADILLFTGDARLPRSGVMGILLSDTEPGVAVTEVVPGSGAQLAGIKKDDLIRSIDGVPVYTSADVMIEMLDCKPGDRVRLALQRRKLALFEKALEIEVVLGE